MSCGFCGCSVPYGRSFKLSLFGVLVSLILALSGIIAPSRAVIELPLSLVAAALVLLPSLVLYYSVRDKFWAEVFEKQKKK
jgi:hypothetical protein